MSEPPPAFKSSAATKSREQDLNKFRFNNFNKSKIKNTSQNFKYYRNLLSMSLRPNKSNPLFQTVWQTTDQATIP